MWVLLWFRGQKGLHSQKDFLLCDLGGGGRGGRQLLPTPGLLVWWISSCSAVKLWGTLGGSNPGGPPPSPAQWGFGAGTETVQVPKGTRK